MTHAAGSLASVAIAARLNAHLRRRGGGWPLERLFREAHAFCLVHGCRMRFRVDDETFHGGLGYGDLDAPARERIVFWAWDTGPAGDDMVVLRALPEGRVRAYAEREAPAGLAAVLRLFRSIEPQMGGGLREADAAVLPSPPH